MSKRNGPCRVKLANGTIIESDFIKDVKHGYCTIQYTDMKVIKAKTSRQDDTKIDKSIIAKGRMKNDKHSGTWDWYKPLNDDNLTCYCKVDYDENGEMIREYDHNYEDRRFKGKIEIND